MVAAASTHLVDERCLRRGNKALLPQAELDGTEREATATLLNDGAAFLDETRSLGRLAPPLRLRHHLALRGYPYSLLVSSVIGLDALQSLVLLQAARQSATAKSLYFYSCTPLHFGHQLDDPELPFCVPER